MEKLMKVVESEEVNFIPWNKGDGRMQVTRYGFSIHGGHQINSLLYPFTSCREEVGPQ